MFWCDKPLFSSRNNRKVDLVAGNGTVILDWYLLSGAYTLEEIIACKECWLQMDEMEGGVQLKETKGHGTHISAEPAHHPVLLFDGVCNLCNGAVQFIIRRDRRAIIHFAPIQWEGLEAWLQTNNIEDSVISSIISSDVPQSVMLVHEGKVYFKSDAALQVVRYLDGGWPMLGLIGFLPRSIRDFLYHFIARNRYRWFGRREACMIPTPELRVRFIHFGVG